MATTWRRRVDGADWQAVTADMNEFGGALTSELLTPTECAALIALYADDRLFRATVDMARHRYGRGEYRYFDRPCPHPIDELKHALYPRLLAIARDWWAKLGREAPWPDTLDEWLDLCHRAGQTKPTALLLKYGPGDWNALHRDLYGDLVFPLQVVINLSAPDVTIPAASSCWSSSGRGRSRVVRPARCRRGTAMSSPPGSGRSARRGDGRPSKYVTECRWSGRGSATRSA